jgi:hypothetical protein
MFLSLVISSSVFAEGYFVTSDLWIKAVINTVEKGSVDAVFYNGGEKTTSRGDKVIWGYFYASPDDVSWGDQGNPDLYVKIWFDVSGRVDVNYFHVSVPDIIGIKNGQILDNAYGIIGIEFMAAAQALDLRDHTPGQGVQKAKAVIRKYVDYLDVDRPLHVDHTKMQKLVRSAEILEEVENEIGNLS